MDIFTCKDINGETVDIDYSELMKQFSNGGMALYGMGMKEIAALRKQYMLKGGKMPITKERIVEVFKGEALDPDEVRWMLEILLSLAPEWATKMEKGLDPIYYGTGSYEGDLGVYAKIQSIKKLVEDLKEEGK